MATSEVLPPLVEQPICHTEQPLAWVLVSIASSPLPYIHWGHPAEDSQSIGSVLKKSRIRETKHLSTDADSTTDAMGGWTKNTP